MKLLCHVLGCRFYRKNYLGERYYINDCVRCGRQISRAEQMVLALRIMGHLK